MLRRFCLLIITLSLSSLLWASPEQAVKSLGIKLKDKGKPGANYIYAVQNGNLLFLAGHISVDADGNVIKGKLGDDMTTAQGAHAARMAGISILSTIRQQLGSLDRVDRLVKVTGMVNATADYTEHSSVINGFSDLMVEVFGEKGRHARSAVGMSSLPVGAAVEIEVILQIK
ncbi:RidA family protein [Aestuariibacter salexigens]|uniref:RidA family protein n=1 Tax=Aestuariibacter salexigens TaxID=226010 RepID=UPI000429B5C2|nr:RidA family protein [Aestuariibacter salexigens]